MGNEGSKGSKVTTKEQLSERRQQLFNSSERTTFEILSNLRSGKVDYDFTSKKSIGLGGQAEVFQLKSNIDQKIYAAKALNIPPIQAILKNEIQAICVEIDILRKLDHVQVVKLLDMFKDEANKPCLVMEKFDSSL